MTKYPSSEVKPQQTISLRQEIGDVWQMIHRQKRQVMWEVILG